ncbi:Uncharacterised protein [Klebsiella pneumoniae]|nr:Uncharacterised protein [Klebsiella pneumoniae]
MHATAGGVNQHGGGAVNHVPGRNLLAARLQEVFFGHRRTRWGNTAVDGEDGTDRHVNVDVGGAVQRIHQHHVLAVFDAFEDHNLIFFFRGDTGHDAARFQSRLQLFVGKQIELHLFFALNIFSAAGAENIDQASFVNIAVDDLRAQLDRGD